MTRPAHPGAGWLRLGLAGAAALLAEVLHLAQVAPALIILLSAAAVLGAGLQTYRKGWIALKNRNLNINALMSVAVTGAMAIGQWPEAAMVMVLFSLAELIEAKSLDRARHAIHGLLSLAPDTASRQSEDGSWVEVEAKTVSVGSRVRVLPGERIALDGVVDGGRSAVDQSPITGESVPVDKAPGDTVFAGTINTTGALEFRVTAAADDSTLARIIHAVESAQASRAPTQRFVDRFARIYTPVVFILACLVAVIPPLFFGMLWFDWIYRALVLLVIACPCALVISTPVTVVSGLAAAAHQGILIKGGAFLEAGYRIRALALDKTGTLTRGKPSVVDFTVLHKPMGDAHEEETLRLASALASHSDHPVSQAIARYGSRESHALPEGFEALPGRGVKGMLSDRLFHLGNHRLAGELGAATPELDALLRSIEAQGRTAVLLIEQNPDGGAARALALFGIADTLREHSREAMAELHRLGVRTVMLTGDNAFTARAIASQAGIDDVRAELLPQDKLDAMASLVDTYGHAGMVGDGINDAPALARASIGFAMGAAGSDTALETADVALMDDDMRKLPAFIRLSRRTVAVLRQNIALALGIKVIFFALALTGQATLWMAVFADMGASLLVVFNGLRLLRHRKQ